jgi:hypothetical protein
LISNSPADEAPPESVGRLGDALIVAVDQEGTVNHTELQQGRLQRAADHTCSADPADIADTIDHLVAAINEDSLLAVWAVSRLAAKLGITVAISPSTDPVEVVRDLGEDWADLIIATNREDPDRAPDVFLAAHAVFERIKRGPVRQPV